MSNEGQNLRDHLVQKYGRAAVASMLDADPQNSRLHQMGRAVAIHFNDERKMVNTIQAHALVEAVKERQSQPQSQPQDGTTTTSSSSTTSHGGDTTASNRLMEHLFRLYFEQAVDINDRDVLVNAARTVTGMEASDATLAMAAHNQDRIRTLDRQIKRQWNVSGVPFYIIEPIFITNNNNADHDDEPITFSGAYPINVIAEHLKKAAAVATAAATAQH